MPIIAISRGSYRQGKAVAEKLAEKLGFECIARDQVVAELDEFHLPEFRLVRNLNDTFSVLERFPNGKANYINAFASVFLRKCMADNIVYHGLAGAYFLRDLPHVLKVRIISDINDRVAQEMAREGISAKEARFILKKDDEERRKWCMVLYGIDIWNSNNYHLVMNIGQLTVSDAVDIIAAAAGMPTFQISPQSKSQLADEALSALVRRNLFEFPSAVVHAQDGRVYISLKAPEEQHVAITEKIAAIANGIDGVKDLEIKVSPYY